MKTIPHGFRRRPSATRAGLVALMVGLGFAAVGVVATPAGAEDSGSIIVVAGPLTDPFFGAIKKGTDDAAHDFGVNVRYVPTDISGPTLAQALQAAIADHPAGLAFGDWFPSAEDALVAAAVKDGLPVVTVNAAPANWRDTGSFAFVGQDDKEAGVLGGQLLAQAGAHRVLCVNHSPGSTNLEERCTGLAEALKPAGGTTSVLNIPTADATNPGKVTQAIRGALDSDAAIDAVFTLGSGITQDAVRAAKEQGVGGKLLLGAVDISASVLQSIAAGDLRFTIDQQPYLQGYNAVAILAQNMKYGLHLVGQIGTGPAAITKSNVDRVIKANDQYRGVRGAS